MAQSQRLSKHFSLDELTVSENAARAGIPNDPSPVVRVELIRLCHTMLERIRELCGNHPVIVTSGYRSPMVDWMAQGKDPETAKRLIAEGHMPTSTSQHCKGQAADFIIPGFGRPLDICQAIVAADLPFDQLIREYDNGVQGWTHVSIPPLMGRPRRMVLTIDRTGTRHGLE